MRPAALLASSALVLGLVGVAPAQAAPPAAAADFSEATGVIVTWKDGTNGGDRTDALRRVGLPRGERLPLLRGERAATAPDQAGDIAAQLSHDPAVAFAEPDHPLRVSSNDPSFGVQWGLHNTGQTILGTAGTPDVDVDAPEAWSLVTPGSPVTVAVLDTGADLAHPDLAPNAWRNPGEVAGNGVDDDQNGYVDDVHGWDFIHSDASVYDVADGDEHGTHVAGTIGAATDNGIGLAGVARAVRLMSLKIIGPESGNTSDAIKAIAYAKAKGATVLNASWGGPGYSQSLRDAISSSGLLFLAAAGNGGDDGIGDDASVTPDFPAALRLPNLVSVAAVDASGALAPYSNYGASRIDLGGPGTRVGSTIPGGKYGYMSGTSMATPHVAGVGALLAAANPALSGSQLAELLKSSTVPLPSLAGKTVTGGMVNAAAALTALAAPAPAPAPAPTASPSPTASPLPTATPSPTASPSPTATPSPTASPSPTTSPSPSPSPTASPSPTPTPTSSPSPAPSASPLPTLLPTPTPTIAPQACPATLPATGFQDVDGASVHAEKISCAAWWGIVLGTSTEAYSPSREVTRGQMALFLSRIVAAAGLETSPGTSPFGDVQGRVGEAVALLNGLGIVHGTSPTTYSPERLVDRAQMATFLVRLHERVTGAPLPAGGTPFEDLPTTVHATSIDKAFTAGIAKGVSATSYAPGRLVRRDQMASFLMNEVDLLVRSARLAARS